MAQRGTAARTGVNQTCGRPDRHTGRVRRWTWQWAVLAGALTTVVFAVWRSGFAPVVGEGTYVPWTVAGLIAAVATVCTDRLTHPFIGTTTTGVAAGMAEVITDERAGLDLIELVFLVVSVMVLTSGFSGLHLLLTTLPRARRPWAVAVVVLSTSAFVGWMGWWSLDGSSPAQPDTLLTGALCTLVLATVLGEITVGTWFGGCSHSRRQPCSSFRPSPPATRCGSLRGSS
jgi:hypothetical protein